MDLLQVIDLAAKVGPSGILAAGCYVLWKERQALATELKALQEKRVEESKANTQALLAIAERVHQALDRVEELRR